MHITSSSISDWPALAWVAVVNTSGQLRLWHGPDVEVHEDWFGEIAWDGNFDSADFDTAEHVVGSGGRCRDGNWTFVSASSTLDRLNHTIADADLVVSNSLHALAANLGWEPIVQKPDYAADFQSICRGFKDYQDRIEMDGGPIHVTYHDNLHWSDGKRQLRPKPLRSRTLDDFDDYHQAMLDVLRRLSDNWTDPARRIVWKPIASVSTGYDSPTVCALAKSAVGLQESLTITKGRSGDSDDGSGIAKAMGLVCHTFRRDQWMQHPGCEVPFIAADGKGEDVYFAPAENLLRRRVVMTGYGGTRVWGLSPKTNDELQRGDQSGLSHAEARLHLGYLHLPVPFLVARQPAELRKISRDPSMDSWHVPGDYNCPIARRIVEQQSVPREAFGMTKKAASILFFDLDSFLSPESRRAFDAWYQETYSWPFRFTQSIKRTLTRVFRRTIGLGQLTCRLLSNLIPLRVLTKIGTSSRLREYVAYEPRFQFLFAWACQETIRQYREGASEHF